MISYGYRGPKFCCMVVGNRKVESRNGYHYRLSTQTATCKAALHATRAWKIPRMREAGGCFREIKVR